MEKYTKTNKPSWNFLFSTIKTIKLHSASIKPVINQGFNFKWPQHAFALFGANKGRETIAACFPENCLVCFPALPLSNIKRAAAVELCSVAAARYIPWGRHAAF